MLAYSLIILTVLAGIALILFMRRNSYAAKTVRDRNRTRRGERQSIWMIRHSSGSEA